MASFTRDENIPHTGKVSGHGFDVVVAPAVTAGAYSANDIMGALMTFEVADVIDGLVLIQEIVVTFKAAVTPSLRAILFSADPTGTTKTDNAAYSLAVADAFKMRRTIELESGDIVDHGTPNTVQAVNLAIPMKPASGTKNVYLLLVDLTGVTLTSTSDLQVRLAGVGG